MVRPLLRNTRVGSFPVGRAVTSSPKAILPAHARRVYSGPRIVVTAFSI